MAARKHRVDAPQPREDLRVVYRDPRELEPYGRNARTHSPEQIEQIQDSIREFGFTNPVLLKDDARTIGAGHARTLASLALGLDRIPTITLPGLTDEQWRAYVIADNQLALNAGWDNELLKLEFGELKTLGFELETTGFSLERIGEVMAYQPPDAAGSGAADGEGEDSEPLSDGSLLALTDITIKEPRHVVALGDVWSVGPHVMIIASVMVDWARWTKHLTEGAIFCPYPGPFVPFSSRAKDAKLVMVHPDHYVAGHVLDRYADVHGAGSVRKIESIK